MSNELGAGHARAASFSVKVVTAASAAMAHATATDAAVMCLRDSIGYVFTKGDDVARAASAMAPLLAVTIVLDGIQPVLSGICIHHSLQALIAHQSCCCVLLQGFFLIITGSINLWRLICDGEQ